MSTRPCSGDSRPAMRRKSVDFPDPEGPSSVVTVPAGALKDAPSTAAAPRWLKRFVSASTTSPAGADAAPGIDDADAAPDGHDADAASGGDGSGRWVGSTGASPLI